ncbi:uncharacterized protein L3040_004318 [Drepanopeziza brunnea f. sp. 'multigermtubi']|uniref:uncharacterized protein n=1 Tax=Drepanopeziza brunnea f. sp. 'multigermtubi' TaxID=698441 RepID=UPI002383E3A3|nr:hypothetical protein L3040_004318 [Drepanopeziza brunnea f. sp. 'multigermtubi']
MNLFGNKNSGIKPVRGVVRTIRVQSEVQPTALPSAQRPRHEPPQRSQQSQATPARVSPSSSTASPAPSSDQHASSHLRPPKRKADQRVQSDSDDNEDGGDKNGIFGLCAARKLSLKLMYPGASQLERFDLIPGKDKIDSIKEICEIAQIVRDVYLTASQAKAFSSTLRPLEAANNEIGTKGLGKETLQKFGIAVENYNKAVRSLFKNGSLAKNLENLHDLPYNMIEFILRQGYDRAVSPQVDLLQFYSAKDNTYGELLCPFVSRVLGETGLKSDQVFVDLGSGVGSVVLQAALQFGCESWGCEIMPKACELADKQLAEFAARCRLWGLQTGKVHLEKGDFLENDVIKAALRKADVVLVNNKVFSSETNEALRYLFLDLKDGCHIVSLQSFAVGNGRNENDLANLIQNKITGVFFDKDISWTNGTGQYFIATKDQGHLDKISAASKLRS